MSISALLVDFNSYFASCEQQVRPELRGKPVGVVPMLADSTCLIAASIEAKRFGVKTLTNVAEAKRRIPDIQLLVARHDLYVDFHHRAVAAVDEIAPVRHVLSIDEMVCDLPAGYKTVERASDLALQIKRHLAIRIGECMTVSIGLAPNVFLAKLASDMQKPNGLVVLQEDDVPAKILHLPLRALNGVGANMLARLERFGISNMAQLYAQTPAQLRTVWGGVEGERFYAKLRGVEVSRNESAPASIGHSHVLPPLLRNLNDAYAVTDRLLQKAAMRLRKIDCFTRRLSVKVKFLNAPTWVIDTRLAETQDTLLLLHALTDLWKKCPRRRQATPLQVGVTLSDLTPASAHTASLFAEHEDDRPLNSAIDAVTLKFGKRAVYFGGAHRAIDHGKLAIAFNHIPDVETEG